MSSQSPTAKRLPPMPLCRSPTVSPTSSGKPSPRMTSPDSGKFSPPFSQNGKWRIVAQVIATLLVLIIIAAAVTVTIVTKTRPVVTHSCFSMACQTYASILRRSRNESIDPCHDFYTYVCGNWRKIQSLSVQQEALERFKKTVISQASSPLTQAAQQTPVEKASLFYQTCENALYTDTGGLERVKVILADADVHWPRRTAQPDIVSTMLYLASHWMWESFIDVHWIAMQGSPEISVEPSVYFQELLLHRKDIIRRDKYLNYFSLIYDSFRNSNETAAQVYAQIVNIESIAAPLFEGAINSPRVKLIMTVRNFTLTAPQIPSQRWHHGFEKYFSSPEAPDPAVVTNSALYMQAISTLVKRVGESNVHFFLGWTIVQKMVLLINATYITNFYGRREGTEETHKSFCFHLVQQRMGFAFQSKYVSDAFTRPVEDDVSRIVSHIRLTFDRVLSRNAFSAGDFRATPTDGRNNFAVQFLNMFLEKFLNIAYSNYSNMEDDVVSNYNLSGYGCRLTSLKQAVTPPHFGTPQDGDMVALFHSKNEFALAPNSLEIPFYDFSLTTSVKYGALGSLVATALTRLLYGDYDGWDEVSKQKLRSTMVCLFDNSAFAKLEPNALSPIDRHVLVASTAIDVLWRAFQSTSGENRQLDAMTPEKIFFVVWCYILCDASYSDPTHLCNSPLRHSPDFASAFACESKSPMVAERDCRLFEK